MTHDETLYFLGGYVKDLEDMSAAKFAEMLKNVDMSDPDQAAAAGAMSNKLMSNEKVDTKRYILLLSLLASLPLIITGHTGHCSMDSMITGEDVQEILFYFDLLL